MSDNGNPYRSRLFAELVGEVGALQIFTPPYTPRWNGKAEKFVQTLKREWAYAHVWSSSTERSRCPAIHSALLQPPQATQLTGRPAADQPRS